MGQNGIVRRFRGSYVLKVDDRGRIKVPSRYLSVLEDQFGKELYITSINGDCVLLYPLKVWEDIEQTIERMKVRAPEIENYISRTSFWGNESEVDSRGRVLIPPELRLSSKLNENVRIFGKIDHMIIWNEEVFRMKALSGEFTDKELYEVSRLLNEFSTLPSNE
jgi:MraZ protein